jgi:long-chain acyl-CoA synthetase
MADEITARLTAAGPFAISVQRIRGVETRVWKNAPASLAAVLESSRAHGARAFTVYEGERTSFAEHYRRAAAFAHALAERYGVGKGDRVAIAMRNYPEWPVAFWGAAAAGAVVVPLNAWGTGDELAFALADCGAKILVADGARLERLRPLRSRLPLEGVIGVRGEGEPSDGADLAELVGSPREDLRIPELALGPEDDATIFYTSGTTGRPKGAVGTQRNICGNVVSLAFAQVRAALRAGADPAELAQAPPPVHLLTVPLFHVTGCHGLLLAATAFGGTLVMMYRWDPERALELIESEAVTAVGGVPAMIWQMLESPSFAKHDLGSLRTVAYGGAPAPPELLRRLAAALPQVAASNGYGITETSSIVSLNSGADYVARPESAGLALPVCELRVVDEAGGEVAAGGVGELWVRGPNVVRGYWGMPEASAESFRDGWFHTGDVVRVDAEGFVSIVDRVKDVVIRGGENVYCAEVEGVLFEHPEVLDAAVIGVPHDVLGEEVAAVVQLRPGGVAGEAELREHVAARLAAFKVPSRVWLVGEALPRNAAGKVLKRELRDRLPT